MTNILFLGNCQFAKLGALMRATTPHAAAIHRTITPHWGKFDEVDAREQLANADIVVAQAITNPDATFNIDDIRSSTKGDIVFAPYVYVDGLADLELISSKGVATIKGGEKIKSLATRMEPNKIIHSFIRGDLDLEVGERFNHSIDEMKRREKSICDIAISDFIQEIHQDTPVSYAINHPTQPVIFEMFRRLCLHLDVAPDDNKLNDIVLHGRMALPLAMNSLTPFSVEKLGLKYPASTHWYANGVRLINMALGRTKLKEPFDPELYVQ